MIKFSLIFLALFSVWITRDLFRPDFFQSHDALYHVVRLDQFHKSFISGQIPVRWAPDLLNGLGYPLFVVNYHLPYYLAEVFHLVGFSLFTAIKGVFIVSLITSAFTGFWLFYSWTKKPSAATLGAVFYILAPYRLANIFERGALGEALAYAFVPLLFLGLDHIRTRRSPHLFIFALTATSLSHTVVLLVFLPVILVYWLVHRPLQIKLVLISLIGTFGLTAFQLFPVIFERHYLKFDANLLTAYQGHFKSLYQLLRLPHPSINIGTRFQVGLTHLLVVLVSLFSFARGRLAKQGDPLMRFFIIVFMISLFLITPVSQFLWDNLPLLPMVLYPWRFLGVAAFATAALAALLRPKFLVTCLLLLAVLFTNRHYIRVDEFIAPVFPQELLAGNATTQNEFDPIYPNKLGSPGQETPIRQAGNWLSVFSLLIWLLL